MDGRKTLPTLLATLLDFPRQLVLTAVFGAAVAAVLGLVLNHGPVAVAWLRHVISA